MNKQHYLNQLKLTKEQEELFNEFCKDPEACCGAERIPLEIANEIKQKLECCDEDTEDIIDYIEEHQMHDTEEY